MGEGWAFRSFTPATAALPQAAAKQYRLASNPLRTRQRAGVLGCTDSEHSRTAPFGRGPNERRHFSFPPGAALVVAKSAWLRFRLWRKLHPLPCSSSSHRNHFVGFLWEPCVKRKVGAQSRTLQCAKPSALSPEKEPQKRQRLHLCHRRGMTIPGPVWAANRAASSKAVRFICRRQRFTAFR